MDQIINHVANRRPSSSWSLVIYGARGRTCLTLAELDRLARKTALHLKRLGVSAGDRIGIIAKNCLEWVLLDLAAIKIRAVTAGFEAGKFAPTAELAERYGLRLIFSDQAGDGVRVLPIAELLAAIEDIAHDPDLDPVAYAPGDVTTIKFTSGSTGQPKGLAATVGSIDSSISAVQSLFSHAADDTLFIFLPLSLLQQRYWIYSALVYGHGVVLSTYERAFHAMKQEAPTVVMGVPAFFEALRKDILSRVRNNDPDGLRVAAEEALGTRCRYLWTGSAPAAPEMLRFFERCGIAIFEGYGMNETCIVTKNAPGANRLGSVGRPLPGKRVSIDDDGVVIVSSDFPVNREYLFCSPGESELIFRPDGSVRTGDLGRIDADGFLYILGRADDIVVLENGRNILVRPIEEKLRACSAIENCIVTGFGRSHLVAIICAAPGSGAREQIERYIADLNEATRPDERIGTFMLTEEPFSIENGLLTSQYKPKRKAILERYGRDVAQASRGMA
ncbi:MAG: AMP-binding protein [Sulfurifustaceae bacterium]